ncbi:MAG: hypothetical protein GXX84_14640 [Acidobacteria bacterium]|nr:hypothetical protein [Acidobacteriota bacterium]
MKNAVPSIGAGLLLAFLGSRFIADLLYDVSPHDPLVFLSVAGSVLVIAVTASLVPAWRACRIARHARFMVSCALMRTAESRGRMNHMPIPLRLARVPGFKAL